MLQHLPQTIASAEQSSGRNVCPATPLQSSVLRKHPLEKPLPVPFVLPNNYPPVVAAGIQAKNLTGRAMVKFITAIANAIFHHKSYPTWEEKEHVARQCVKTFPFLESNCGSVHVSGIYILHAIYFTYIVCMYSDIKCKSVRQLCM